MEIVVVEIAFSYAAVYRMPRRRSFETGLFRSSIPFPLHVAEGRDAPVVCQVRSHRSARPDEGYDYAVRCHDGRFWRPLHEDRNHAPLSLERFHLLASAPADGTANWHRNPFLNIAMPVPEPNGDFDRRSGNNALHKLKTVEQAGVREVASSELAEAEARLAAGVDRFRLIDGIVYEQCFEPKLVISVLHGDLKFTVVTDEECGDGWVVEAFRPDRSADARRFAAWLAKDQGITRHGAIKPMPRIEAPRPDLLKRSDVVCLTQRHLDTQLENVRRIAAYLPDHAVASFLRMRRAAAALRLPSATEIDAQAFLEMTAEIARAADILSESDEEGLPWTHLRDFYNDAQLLLARWRLTEGGPRPLELVAGEEEALALLGAAP